MNYLKLKYIKYVVLILFLYILFSIFVRIVNVYTLLFLIIVIYTFYNIDKKLFNNLTENGIVADWREPDVIRIAPVPLYNTFTDAFNFYQTLKKLL